jgi:hypothetical protein
MLASIANFDAKFAQNCSKGFRLKDHELTVPGALLSAGQTCLGQTPAAPDVIQPL